VNLGYIYLLAPNVIVHEPVSRVCYRV